MVQGEGLLLTHFFLGHNFQPDCIELTDHVPLLVNHRRQVFEDGVHIDDVGLKKTKSPGRPHQESCLYISVPQRPQTQK